ncbi:hypothetical protein GW7_06978 [Heterocephalus glaber]|uniref:Uncharacterized protein n=1 Tax=Heterocephalus glaber TaxID=10181 RepID=G5BTG6_HETGA|nr:hypothetical protein GW7_06978 [Heterocephalus glaber]
MLRLPPLPSGPRRAEPQGVCARQPRRLSHDGPGRCPTGPPGWQPLQNAKMIPPPLGEREAATKWCLSGPRLQWREGRGRIQAGRAGEEGAGPTRGRLRREGGRGAGRERGRALRRRQRTHPHTHTRALAAAAPAAGGWRRLVHYRRGSSQPRQQPRDSSPPALVAQAEAAAALCCSGRTQPRTGTSAASR